MRLFKQYFGFGSFGSFIELFFLFYAMVISTPAAILTGKTNFYKKLEMGIPQKLLTVGTSISATNYGLYWPEKLVEKLNNKFQYRVSYGNINSPASTDAFLVSAQTSVKNQNPDVVIYEVSMITGTSGYEANLRSVVHQTRVNLPNCDIVFWAPWPAPGTYAILTSQSAIAKQIAVDSCIYWVDTWPVMDSIYKASAANYKNWLPDDFHPSQLCVDSMIHPYILNTLRGINLKDANTVREPECTPYMGEYNVPKSITLTSATSGAIIRYTTDGTDPTTTSTLYATPITFSSTTTLKAQAFKTGLNNSSILSCVYKIVTATPTFTPAPGGYKTNPTLVTLSCVTPNATIRYTTDNSEPSRTNGMTYSTPVSISSATVIKTMAYSTGYEDGKRANGIYFISDSVFSDTSVHTTNVAHNNWAVQSDLIPCLYAPSTWNRLVVTFDCKINSSAGGFGSWLGYAFFDQGPKMNLTTGASFPSQCITVGHYCSDGIGDGSHSIFTWKMASANNSWSKWYYSLRRFPVNDGNYFNCTIVFNKQIASGVELSYQVSQGQIEWAPIVDTITTAQWNSVVAANGRNLSLAGQPYNDGMVFSIKNIRVARTNESITTPVHITPKVSRLMVNGITQNATMFIVQVGEQGKHSVAVYNLKGKVVFLAKGTGNHQYTIPRNSMSNGVYMVQIKTKDKMVVKTLTKCVE